MLGKPVDDAADEQDVHVHEVARTPRAKYSSAMLRPPITAIAPSAMKSLLCIRWLSRSNSDERDGKPRHHALPRAAKRIEQPHLDVRKRCQTCKQRIGARRIQIVDEQPHPHTAQRGIPKAAHEQPAAAIVLNQVVLNVERRSRPLDELDSRVERIQAERHEPEPARRWLRDGFACDANEWAISGRRKCQRDGSIRLRRKSRARGQADCQDAHQSTKGQKRH